MEKFHEFARAVGEADRLIRTAPLHNSEPSPGDDLLKQIKDKLESALSLHSGAAKEVRARAKDLAQVSAASASDDTAHLALAAPHTPPSQPEVPGDPDHEGPAPDSAPDLDVQGDENPPSANAPSSRRSRGK